MIKRKCTIIGALLICLTSSLQGAFASHLPITNLVGGTNLGRMVQGTDFNGSPSEANIEAFLTINITDYPIQNNSTSNGVVVGVEGQSKDVTWDLTNFDNMGMGVILVLKNNGVADLILANSLVGSVTLGHGLSNWGLAKSPDLKPVPIPAAIWLFGSAVVGLVSFRSKRPLTETATV